MINYLFDKWNEIQKRPQVGMGTVGGTLQRIHDELEVLESLKNAGCERLPENDFSVQFLINKRHKLLREMEERLTNI